MINQGLELLQFTPLNVKLCSKVVAWCIAAADLWRSSA